MKGNCGPLSNTAMETVDNDEVFDDFKCSPNQDNFSKLFLEKIKKLCHDYNMMKISYDETIYTNEMGKPENKHKKSMSPITLRCTLPL